MKRFLSVLAVLVGFAASGALPAYNNFDPTNFSSPNFGTITLTNLGQASSNSLMTIPFDYFRMGSDTANLQAAVDAATRQTQAGSPLNVSISSPRPLVITSPIKLWGTVHIIGNAQPMDAAIPGLFGNGFTSTNIICTSGSAFVQTNVMNGTVIEGLGIVGPGKTNIGTAAIKFGNTPIGFWGQNDVVRNCNISGFERAVESQGIDNLLVENVWYAQVTNGFAATNSGGTIQACTIRRVSGFREGTGIIINGGTWYLEGCDTFKNGGVQDTTGIDISGGARVNMKNMNVETGNPSVNISVLATVKLESGLYGNNGVGPTVVLQNIGGFNSELYIGDTAALLSAGPTGNSVLSWNPSGEDNIITKRTDIIVSNANFNTQYRATPFVVSLGGGTVSNPKDHAGKIVNFALQGLRGYDNWIGHSIAQPGVGTNWNSWDDYPWQWDVLKNVNKSDTTLGIGPLTMNGSWTHISGIPASVGGDVNQNTRSPNTSKHWFLRGPTWSMANGDAAFLEYNSGAPGLADVRLGFGTDGISPATTQGFLGAGVDADSDPGAGVLQWDINAFKPINTNGYDLGAADKKFANVYTTNLVVDTINGLPPSSSTNATYAQYATNLLSPSPWTNWYDPSTATFYTSNTLNHMAFSMDTNGNTLFVNTNGDSRSLSNGNVTISGIYNGNGIGLTNLPNVGFGSVTNVGDTGHIVLPVAEMKLAEGIYTNNGSIWHNTTNGTIIAPGDDQANDGFTFIITNTLATSLYGAINGQMYGTTGSPLFIYDFGVIASGGSFSIITNNYQGEDSPIVYLQYEGLVTNYTTFDGTTKKKDSFIYLDAVNGNDTNAVPGHKEYPFKTTSAVVRIAESNDTVLMAPGTVAFPGIITGGINWVGSGIGVTIATGSLTVTGACAVANFSGVRSPSFQLKTYGNNVKVSDLDIISPAGCLETYANTNETQSFQNCRFVGGATGYPGTVNPHGYEWSTNNFINCVIIADKVVSGSANNTSAAMNPESTGLNVTNQVNCYNCTIGCIGFSQRNAVFDWVDALPKVNLFGCSIFASGATPGSGSNLVTYAEAFGADNTNLTFYGNLTPYAATNFYLQTPRYISIGP